MNDFSTWEKQAKFLRKLILTSTTAAGSGHVTSSFSATELGTVLFDKYFTYDLSEPLSLTNDRFVMSKGHASPLFYGLYALAGAMPVEELQTLRKFGSELEGHPTPHFKYTDAATGSLGQGLSVGNGLAYLLKQKKIDAKVYVMLGDGEIAEGQIWEAANFASFHKLNNLIVIADINRLGQSQETMFGHHMHDYEERFKAFGFETIIINGHDLAQIDDAYTKAVEYKSEKPFIILAETVKGKGISFLEDKDGWHGKALKKEEMDKALEELGEVDESVRFTLRKPKEVKVIEQLEKTKEVTLPVLKKDEEIGTREVYGKTLSVLATAHPHIYALDADMKNSTYSEDFLKTYPDRFIECFIAEQNMVSVSVGLSRLNIKPFVSTFASFLIRAADQIRMASISQANIAFIGAHVGVSIGEDGPSQMGLEDIALFGTIPGSIIFHPADAVSMPKVLPHVLSYHGISYIRMLRPKVPVLYDTSEDFTIGGSKVLRSSDRDDLTIAATGITVHEALKAQTELEKNGIYARVIDCYSIKPVDKDTLLTSLKSTKKPVIVTVEDHFTHGGFGDIVNEALAGSGATVAKLAVGHISRSGKPAELLADARIDATAIVESITNLLS